MSNFEDLFSDMYDFTIEKPTHIAITKCIEPKSKFFREALNSPSTGPQNEFVLQEKIRPYFGKPGIKNTKIGTHPDFITLEGTDNGTKLQYACTLFVDIMGSTRLSLLYPLEDVFLFKNAVIKTCIEMVRSFDGHVHRLMGDAVMAFFGNNQTEKENAIADAINCSITLRAFLEGSIKPWMEKKGFDTKDFGFRIGCDFGDDDDVLWGNFGYTNVGEVSATGFSVDMASKLQGLANKNQTMLGQGLLNFINWPEKYSQVKEKIESGNSKKLPVVIPNITDSNGTPVNYKMRLLAYDGCLNFSPLPRSYRATIATTQVIDNPNIGFKCYAIFNDERSQYISVSKYLDKKVSLEFEVHAETKTRLKFPLKVRFTKTNNGKDVPENERDFEQKPKEKNLTKNRTSSYNTAPPPVSRVVLEEKTLYRGLHTMKCEVIDTEDSILFRDWIGILIK